MEAVPNVFLSNSLDTKYYLCMLVGEFVDLPVLEVDNIENIYMKRLG